jgi:hypothetical protein
MRLPTAQPRAPQSRDLSPLPHRLLQHLDLRVLRQRIQVVLGWLAARLPVALGPPPQVLQRTAPRVWQLVREVY